MKSLLSLLLLFCAVQLQAGNIYGFNAAQSGDTVKVIPGTYGNTYISQPPITGRKTIIDATGCTFIGTLMCPDVFQDVVFQNFTFSHIGGECVRWSPNSAAERPGVQAKNIIFRNCTADACGAFTLWGTYSDVITGLSLSQYIEFSNITVTNALTNQVFFLSKSYNLLCHDIKITGTGSPDYDAHFSHDGIFFVRWSDGEFYNNTIRGHKGNGYRIYPSGIAKGTRGIVKIHDCYVENGRMHSAVEANGNYSVAGYNADIYVSNNTFGDLQAGSYHCAGLSVYPEPSGSNVYFENNVVFNTDINDTNGGGLSDSVKLVFTDTGMKPTSNKNNWYYGTADAAGVDLNTGRLLSSAPQYGKAGAWISAQVQKEIKSITILYKDGTFEIKP